MAAWTGAAEVEAVALPRPRPRRAKAAPRRAAGGVVWIGVLAVLLVGVVALTVAVLRLNMQIERLGEERLELQAENALLESKISSAVARHRIEQQARSRLGLEPAADPTYLELRRER